jgi:hypothetical protein
VGKPGFTGGSFLFECLSVVKDIVMVIVSFDNKAVVTMKATSNMELVVIKCFTSLNKGSIILGFIFFVALVFLSLEIQIRFVFVMLVVAEDFAVRED